MGMTRDNNWTARRLSVYIVVESVATTTTSSFYFFNRQSTITAVRSCSLPNYEYSGQQEVKVI